MRAALAASVAVAGAAGCTTAFRTMDGAALAPPGVAGGRSNSIYLGDRGGPLTRLGIGLLGTAAALGAFENIKQEVADAPVVDQFGRRVGTVRTTTTTATVNQDQVRRAADLTNSMNQAADDTVRRGAVDVTEGYASYTGGLEIATRDLGGDTSGWIFDFGVRWGERRGAWGVRGAVKLAFGKMTFHGRDTLRGNPAEMPVTSRQDSTFSYLGLPSRLGITYDGHVEVFGQLDLNLLNVYDRINGDAQTATPSPWRAGGRLFLPRGAYVEAAVALSSMRAAERSTLLEVGLDF